jgi:hypothetical protein
MLDERQLRALSPQERLELMQMLAAMEPATAAPRLAGGRRRAITLAFIIACCVILAAWTGVLAATLPRFYRTGGWRGAWVGFDIALLGAFVATAWASWRRRQILIICLIVLATLLCCDAWFDVVLDARTRGFELSLLSALVVELPLAALAIFTARRLLRRTSGVLLRYQGHPGPTPRMRDMTLVGTSQSQPLCDLLTGPDEPGEEAEAGRSTGSRIT